MLKLLGKKQPEYPELPTLVSKVLQPYVKQLEGNIFVQSFHRPYLEELRSLMPELQLVYLTLSSNRSWLQREDLQIPLTFSGVSVRHTALTPDAVKELQKIQGHVFAWTVDSEISLCSMMAAGVDGVITNRPDTAVALLAEGNFSAPKRRRCCRSRAKLAWQNRFCHEKRKHEATRSQSRTKQFVQVSSCLRLCALTGWSPARRVLLTATGASQTQPWQTCFDPSQASHWTFIIFIGMDAYTIRTRSDKCQCHVFSICLNGKCSTSGDRIMFFF